MWPEKGWIRPVGPKDSPKIAIVGEAPGEEEVRMGGPFVGPSGHLLNKMLKIAGIDRDECYLTNVFLERPPMNDLMEWCVTKTEANQLWLEEGNSGKYPYPIFSKGKFLRPDKIKALSRLQLELGQIKPNMVLALGNTACWALLGTSGITKLRGTLAKSTLIPGLKILPTFHPAAILRQWENYVISMMDIIKAARVQYTPELVVPKREIWINPSLFDMEAFFHLHLKDAQRISVDVETKWGQINCISFSPTTRISLVVTLWDPMTKTDPNCLTFEEELASVEFIDRVMRLPATKVYQNGTYDIQYIWKTLGVAPAGDMEDTMLMHHALQPEMKKGLGFLGSAYTDSPAWKHIRKKAMDTEKRDE